MALSLRLLSELRSERKRLLALKQQITADLERIDLVLSPNGSHDAQTPRQPRRVGGIGRRRAQSPRLAITTVLRDHNEGMTPSELAQEVERRGLLRKTKSRMATRMSAELGRMKRKGEIEKRGDKYVLTAT